MSNKVMKLCWPIQVTSTQKAVLMSLADQANDHGVCWPGVPLIASRTCLSERAVRKAIQDLAAAGHIRYEGRTGTSNMYTVTPESGAGAESGAAPAPDSGRDCTSVTSPLHDVQPNHNEPLINPTPPPAGESSPAMGTNISIWDLWVQVTGDQKSRSFLGKQVKDHGEPAVRRAVLETINKQPADPNSYLLGVLKDRPKAYGLSAADRVELANPDITEICPRTLN